MPLKVGAVWTYQSSTPIAQNVRTVKVDSRAWVNHGNGYQLRSESGLTNLIWSHDTLYAGKLSGTLYDPPLPVLRAGLDTADWKWDGQVTGPLAATQAHAEAKQVSTDRDVGGHKTKTEQVTLTITLGKRQQEIVTWY
ncbi:hypothetical protein FYL66_25720, partial [Salmonella enterica subsp. enterica serovar Typhimurium]